MSRPIGRRFIALAAGLTAITLLLLYSTRTPSSSTTHGTTWSYSLSNPFKADSSSGAAESDRDLQQLLFAPDPTDKSRSRDPDDDYMLYSEQKLRALVACKIRGDCHPNADKIVIISTLHCHWGIWGLYNGGEGISCRSISESLTRQGFTVLHAGEANWRFIYHLYRQVPDMVKIVIAGEGYRENKDDQSDQRHWYWGLGTSFIKSKSRPYGIPAWKRFDPAYFPTPFEGIIGAPWTLCTETYPDYKWDAARLEEKDGVLWFETGEEDLHVHAERGDVRYTFTGYTLEPLPAETKVVPWSERPNRIYVFAKKSNFLHNWEMSYPFEWFQKAIDELKDEFPGFEFVAAIDVEEGHTFPDGIKNLGILGPEEFERALSSAKGFLGLGGPKHSPSPYQALAMGIPFINPHRIKDEAKEKNWDLNEWDSWENTQHDFLGRVGEPYVYQILAFDYEQFIHAIRGALSTPIKPLRFKHQSQEATDKRLADLVMYDWRGTAEYILEQRVKGNDIAGGGREHKVWEM